MNCNTTHYRANSSSVPGDPTGVSFGSSYATRPDLITFALPAVPGESRIPTAADLFINGQAFSRLQLAPGPFEIANVPAINGAGELQLVTRDPLGRQQVITVPYYVTPQLLRPGLADGGIDIGRVREDFGLASNHYGRKFARGLWRQGITAGITLEGSAEFTQDNRVAGAGFATALGNFAIASLAASANDGATAGHSLAASVERSSRGFSFSLRGETYSRGFAQIGEVPGIRRRLNAGAGMALGPIGNVSLVYAEDDRYDRGRIATTAISLQRQFARNISLLLNVSSTDTDQGQRRFAGIAVTIPLDVLASATLSSTWQEGRTEHIADLRQNLPAGEGLAGRARVSGGNAGPTRADAGVSWQHPYGLLSADATYASRLPAGRINATGSLVGTGGIVRAVRQLGDAFAVVSVPGYPGIDVFHENQRVAVTDRHGIAVVPRLRAYEANALTLDTLKLALSTELKGARRTVAPPRRGGVLLAFNASETHGALVRVVLENGNAVPAGANLSVNGESFPIAINGEAWVTGLAGDSEAVASWGRRRCTTRIPAPDRKKARPRIGPIVCKEN